MIKFKVVLAAGACGVCALRGLSEVKRSEARRWEACLPAPVQPQPVPAGSNGSNGPTARHSPAPQPQGSAEGPRVRNGPAIPEGRAPGGAPAVPPLLRFPVDSPLEGTGGELLGELRPAHRPR